ncbi:hypothetical protein OEZ85_005766 [Tetradesmus obliquus]|uniref:Prolyl endopeptidase n=1 Tax=Tetradesmus obliquus TaxID=3088 RepID=A0ABY8UJR4_TETOB|nr:hypothetical protein OEZ85_005766 [Tetradesmus obliquus]
MPQNRQATAVVGAAGVVAGYVLGRAANTFQTRKMLGSNYKWMSKEERRVAQSLISHGQQHVFKAWPKRGVNDDAKRRLLTVAASYLQGAGSGLEDARLSVLVPPTPTKQPKELVTHNDTRTDDYYWLRDDARKDPAVLSYLKEENAYTAAAMADTQQLQDALYTEMRARIQEEDTSVATRYQGFYYYTRTEEGQQYAVHCRRAVAPGAGALAESDEPGQQQPEEVLLDENRRKEEGKHSFYMVGCCETSPNQQLLAWTEDTVGGEKYTLHVKDLATGKELMTPILNTSGDLHFAFLQPYCLSHAFVLPLHDLATGKELMTPIPDTSGDVVWANDNATLFYVVKDHLDRPYKVLRHKVGSASAEDPVVYDEKDESFYVGIGRSHSEQLLYIHIGSTVTSETLFMPVDTPEGTFKVVLPRIQDVEYSISHHPGSSSSSSQGWFLITIRDPALPNSELRVAPVEDPMQQTVIQPHSADVKIEAAGIGARWLVVRQRARAQQSVVLHALPQGGAMPQQLGDGQVVQFEEAAYALSGGLTGDFDSEVLRLRYSSLTTPPSVYDQHMATGKRALKKVQPILGGFNKEDYTTQRLWAKAPDGTEVPISLAFRKDLARLDGTDPLLLHGYGSYEHPYDPSFSRDQLSLLDRGWTVAIAHIRGGGDMGRMWYEDGKYLKKRNTFTDFIACAEHLIQERYTSASRLSIEGRSAGGLLMGAVTNMRPDLFNSVLMGVPFVDVLTTMLDETIPLTTIEWEEWGNPQQPDFYEYMKSYSPVDNVKAQDYPHILVTAGLHDPRVGYWEPAKLVAKLRQLKTDKNLLLLKCELGAGHFSVTGRFERLKETAFEYAFLLKTAGMLAVQPTAGSTKAAAAAS